MEKIYRGIGVSEGICHGKAFVFRHSKNAGTSRTISEKDVKVEISRLENAVRQAEKEIDGLIAKASESLDSSEVAVIKGQKTFLSDPAYCPAIKKLISGKLYSAEKAVKEITEQYAGIFEGMDNAYMRERATDVRDCGDRLLDYLSGSHVKLLSEIRHPVILVADDLSPSDTVKLDRSLILAFATEKGGRTSHTSVFAKSLGIPAAVGIPGLLADVSGGEDVIIDGGRGACIFSPQPETVREYNIKMEKEKRQNELFSRFSGQPARTKDGKRVTIASNIGSVSDIGDSIKNGAEGVGLFRTEQIYLSSNSLPDEKTQFGIYREAAERHEGRQVIIRTLDIGGDKEIPYLGIRKENNPFLGYRAIRYCLGNEEIFLTQLRAILRASAYGNLAIMFPMISGVQELRAAKKALEKAKGQLQSQGVPFEKNIKTGIMVEIPSAALMADALAEEANFFSIGTNDLVQYTLAADRGNEMVSYLYDYLNPAVIRLIKHTADAAHAAGIPVGMCGAMAGDPMAEPLLIGLGLDELSMASGALAQAKYTVSTLSTESCRKLAQEACDCKDVQQVHKLLRGYYNDNVENRAK